MSHEVCNIHSVSSRLLSGDLAIVLDIDVVVGGEGMDLVVWELGTRKASLAADDRGSMQYSRTHVNPLTKVYSLTILPPCSSTCFLALRLVSDCV